MALAHPPRAPPTYLPAPGSALLCSPLLLSSIHGDAPRVTLQYDVLTSEACRAEGWRQEQGAHVSDAVRTWAWSGGRVRGQQLLSSTGWWLSYGAGLCPAPLTRSL